MAHIMALVSKTSSANRDVAGTKLRLHESIQRLSGWLDRYNYRGYDTFDGLNAKFLRPLTFNSRFLRMVLQQGVRRFPLNVRPLIGVTKSHSSKGMGFLAKGFMRMHASTGDAAWRHKAQFALQWLIDNQAAGYSGSSWGNHFDYQSRSSYARKGLPSIVWTSLIGHAFLDAYVNFKEERFLNVAINACEHIIHDLSAPDRECLSYFPDHHHEVHNANTLGGSLLGRTYAQTRNETYRALARKAMEYTARHQRADSSWFYGEAANLNWVDNFHTGYVLDSFKYYAEGTSDHSFENQLKAGYRFWKDTFFLADGTPRYYNYKTKPIDIQCCSQAIDTLVFFYDRDPEALSLALRVAEWTIEHMQDRTGYFYYRRYSPWIVNKTPTLHWGQATMLCALAGLYRAL